ncbi:MAG: hypothetical protein QXL54_00445 [Candidatus Bathyarchaeia archaeon]
MFEGKKTPVFWAGLIILTLAALILFAMLYYGVLMGLKPDYVKGVFPLLVGSVIFILIGLYMMKSGTEKLTEKTATATSPTQTMTRKGRGVYWFGLVISASSALFIFQLLWIAFVTGQGSPKGEPYYNPAFTLLVETPFLVAATVFFILGLYMVKSGIR